MHLQKLWSCLRYLLRLNKNCNCLPIEVPDGENIIRAIYYHVHVNRNNTLKWQAYDPTPGTDEVSVMRGGCMLPTDCKKKAKELVNPPSKLYRGLAVLSAGTVRSENMGVRDSRHVYCGHGHISTGVSTKLKASPGEPRDIKEVERVKKMASVLVKLSKYYPDGAPESIDWPAGVSLLPP